jgi:hypothetical protein
MSLIAIKTRPDRKFDHGLLCYYCPWMDSFLKPKKKKILFHTGADGDDDDEGVLIKLYLHYLEDEPSTVEAERGIPPPFPS